MNESLLDGQAIGRLHELERYIAVDSPLVATRVVRRTLLQSQRIATLPMSGRVVPEFERDDIREVLLRPYRVIYQLQGDRVGILTVRHYRELLPEDLPKKT